MITCWCPIAGKIINSITDDSNVVLVVLYIRHQCSSGFHNTRITRKHLPGRCRKSTFISYHLEIDNWRKHHGYWWKNEISAEYAFNNQPGLQFTMIGGNDSQTINRRKKATKRLNQLRRRHRQNIFWYSECRRPWRHPPRVWLTIRR